MDETHSLEPGVLLALAQTIAEDFSPRGDAAWPTSYLDTPFGLVHIRVEGMHTLTLHTMNDKRGHDPILVHGVRIQLNLDAKRQGGAWVVPYSRWGMVRSDGREVSNKARTKLQATLARLVQEWAEEREKLLQDGELARLSDDVRKHEERAQKQLRELLTSLRQVVAADHALNLTLARVPRRGA